MAKIGVCLETFFFDQDYRTRLENVAALGFRGYEFWLHNKRFDGTNVFDEMKDFGMLADMNAKHGLTCTDFVLNHSDGAICASLIDSKDRNLILDGLEAMLVRAKKINCRHLVSASGDRVDGIVAQQALENMITTLSEVAKICARYDVTILLEPFNTRVDHPHAFLDNPYTAVEVVKAVDHANVKILFDIYHMQIMAGNIVDFVKENIQFIGHFHIAGVPGRHEPDSSELNYPFIVKEIEKLGYTGYFGLEYWPAIDHEESLRKIKSQFGV